MGTHLERLQARSLSDGVELAQDCVLDGLVLAQLGQVSRRRHVDPLVLGQLAQVGLVGEDNLQGVAGGRSAWCSYARELKGLELTAIGLLASEVACTAMLATALHDL